MEFLDFFGKSLHHVSAIAILKSLTEENNMFEIKLEVAIETAQLAANVYGLPQTVFKTPDTCGWANTNPFASFLNDRNCDVSVTMLPRNYFA
jgi:hypothetical protein